MIDHRHCRCGRAISPEAKGCPECWVSELKEELDRLRSQTAEEVADVITSTGA